MGDEVTVITDMLPFLIPLIIVELVLLIAALIDLLRREHYKPSVILIWTAIIVIVGIIGPIIYFIFGRKKRPTSRDQDRRPDQT